MVSEALNFLAVKLFLVACQLQTLGLAKSSSPAVARLLWLCAPMCSHSEAEHVHVRTYARGQPHRSTRTENLGLVQTQTAPVFPPGWSG